MKILILLSYFNRPKMVRYALESVRRAAQYHSDFELAFIDDASDFPGEPIVREILASHIDKVTFYNYPRTYDEKVAVGESQHGIYINTAIKNSNADIAIILCDDDALCDDYLKNLSDYFTANPTIISCYSHVQIYDPLIQSPWQSLPTPYAPDPHRNNGTFLNEPRIPLNACCRVDSSQVAWRLLVNKQHEVWFRETQTRDLDAAFYQDMYDKTGYCYFTGFVGQYKGWHARQLGRRAHTFEATWKEDIDIS